jgi:lipopolysaccharide transport system permease protein
MYPLPQRTQRPLAWLTLPLEIIYHHRHILWATTRNDVRARFAGSIFGLAWVILYPLLLLGAYAAVYLYVFKVRFALFNSNEYVAFIFCGLIPFLGFSEALGVGIGCLTSNRQLIKNTLFPADLIPVKAVLTSQFTQLGGLVLLLVVLLLLGKLSLFALWLAPIWLCQVSFTIGLIWVLSSLNIYFRDLQHLASVLIMMLMMVSPVAYTPDMVPASLRVLLHLNPLYYLITAYQECLMLGRSPRPETLAVLIILATGSLIGGHLFFSRLKLLFGDNV